MNLHHPYQIDGRGRTRTADEAVWIRGLVEQVLLTAPGKGEVATVVLGVNDASVDLAAVDVMHVVPLLVAFVFGVESTTVWLGLVILLAAWLLVFDLARRNLRKPGLTGYIAACLFSGYIWLGVGGLLALGYGAVSAGPIYDAILHAIFLGFTFGMIFGHAPIIFPAVLGRPLPYRPSFYLHLVLLQITLVLRIAGDLINGELIERQIVIERPHDIVTICVGESKPCLPPIHVTFRVRVPCHVKPMSSPALAVAGRFQQLIDEVTAAEPTTIVVDTFQLKFLAEAWSFMGEHDKALEASRKTMEMIPLENDHIYGAMMAQTYTFVLARAGKRDEALERLARSLDTPRGRTRWELTLDPRWDFFRDDERFNELIRPRNLETSGL